MIVFLENVTKQNESGRVYPWNYLRKMINEIYKDYTTQQPQFNSALINTTCNFDEFVCLYFLKTHKIRRLAELKLLEFLVSLKYYCKLWSKALLFTNMCGITLYKSSTKDDGGFTYNFDIYTQNFVLESLKKLRKYQGSKFYLEHSEGYTWLHKDKLDEIQKEIMQFLPEVNKQRAVSKISKLIKRIERPEDQQLMDGFDADKMMDIIMEEYFELKRKNYKIIQKGFAKLYESENGLISFDDVLALLNDCSAQLMQLSGREYPGDFTKLRAFMYAMTCSKNSLETSCKDFLNSCMKFGLDCPFPFIIIKHDPQQSLAPQPQSLLSQYDKIGLNKIPIENKSIKNNESLEISEEEQSPTKPQKSANDLVDMSSTLFAQHFSILRELRQYCQQFKQAVKTELDQEALWKHFDNILNILEAGCQFLNFPVNV
eukprot:TRINITY_DN28172_c0_g1_i2.p1 TRINITY_DN28172_c0_g1~~TRINITY_DN28172_c0_g1_i2.p1  ORF type:complete len:429 (-),score=45.32 TRINITY_DN28172_c0_g1_i2:28-1314(-)